MTTNLEGALFFSVFYYIGTVLFLFK